MTQKKLSVEFPVLKTSLAGSTTNSNYSLVGLESGDLQNRFFKQPRAPITLIPSHVSLVSATCNLHKCVYVWMWTLYGTIKTN